MVLGTGGRAKVLAGLVAWLVVLTPTHSRAHHEAIFGPFPALLLSAPNFLTFQTFSRRTGAPNARTQETTSVLSVGLAPFRNRRLSVLVTVPASYIAELDRGQKASGLEDVILGARYRFDFESLQERFGKAGNYATTMLALEVPTGTVDHPAFDGPLDYMAAGLVGFERDQLSLIGYGVGRVHGQSHGEKPGNNLFLGGGVAWTPLDDPSTERLVSLQLGLSVERYFADTVGGAPDRQTGGWGTLLHPTVVWGPGSGVLLFGTTSFPVAQAYRDSAAQDRWRVGAGVIWLLNR